MPHLNVNPRNIVSGSLGGLVGGLICGLIMIGIKLFGGNNATYFGIHGDNFSLLLATIGGLIGGLVTGIFFIRPRQKLNGFSRGLIGGIISVVVLVVAFWCIVIAVLVNALKDA